MKRKHESDRDRLRETLRAGDPARDGREPDQREVARMRARVLSEPVEPVRAAVPFRALAAAALVCLVVALGWGIWYDATRQAPAAVQGSPAVAADDTGTVRASRQIRFSTPGGTRVVWTLTPDFDL